MFFEQIGPPITFGLMLASIGPAFIAARFWADGHIEKLILSGKKFEAPVWVLETFSLEEIGEVEPWRRYLFIYIFKGIAWAINLVWILFLLSEPGCGRWSEQTCAPIYSNAAFHNIALLDIGGIVVELGLFLALTGYFRWGVIREK